MSQTESQNFLGLSFDGTFMAKMSTKHIIPKLRNVITSCECIYSEQTLSQFLFDGTFIAKMPTKPII